jgi:hypothetical protein
MLRKRAIIVLGLLIGLGLMITGCKNHDFEPAGRNTAASEERISISGDGVVKPVSLTLAEMLALPGARSEHVYSIINNWPNKKFIAARGVRIAVLLETAGIKNDARLITIKGEDGYEASFTVHQLLATKRYYFPGLLTGDPRGAKEVEPIIAYEYLENSSQLSEVRADRLCLIIPQADIKEQTNQCFVKAVKEIAVTCDDPGKWTPASVFPAPGHIAAGDTVKLEHKDAGRVKMYYTLDGSIPTGDSPLYNPSAYQPELNRPIVINQDTTIKVVVKGFGKNDSDIAIYYYQVKQGAN